MFVKAVIVLAYITTALAIPFITLPTASTTFTGGRPANVRWQDSGSEPSLEDYGLCSISIYVGNAMQQTRLQTLNASVDVSRVSEIAFTPDPSIGPNSSEYFIRIESLALRDSSQSQYPAMAFSAKFTLDGMTGTFSADVLNQIRGQSTAPLATPTGSSSPASRSASTTTSGSTSSTKSVSSSASAASKSSSASPATRAGWSGILLTVLFGAAVL